MNCLSPLQDAKLVDVVRKIFCKIAVKSEFSKGTSLFVKVNDFLIHIFLHDFILSGDEKVFLSFFVHFCPAFCRYKKFRLDDKRRFAVTGNFTWMTNGLLPLPEISLG
jgi:hypothetical protein